MHKQVTVHQLLVVIVCALLAPGKSRVTWVKECACAITVFVSWLTVTCYSTKILLLSFCLSSLTFSRGSGTLKLQTLHLQTPVSLQKPGPVWVLHQEAGSCCLRLTKIISRRKVHNSLKTLAKKYLLTTSILGLLGKVLRCQTLLVHYVELQGVFGSGLYLLEGWESVWDEASFLVWVSGLKAFFIILCTEIGK